MEKNKWKTWSKDLISISEEKYKHKDSNERLIEIANEIATSFTNLSIPESDKYYFEDADIDTPKVDVRAVIFNEKKILLVEEEDKTWCLPGGWAENGQSPSQNIIREVKEETGFIVHPKKVLAILDRNLYPPTYFNFVYKIFFLCKIVGEEAQDAEFNCNFFERENLPNLSKKRSNEHQIVTMFEYLNDKTLETKFD